MPCPCCEKTLVPAEEKTARVPAAFVRGGTRHPVALEVADTPSARSRGLSKRAEVPSGTGMLFDTPGPFWMRDTLVPLDLVWLSKSGMVVDEATMPVPAPGTPLHELPLYTARSGLAKYAVELPAGWCAEQGVVPGSILQIGE
jgi:uncharacterized membrane protein (UPF0127 family)